MARTRGAPSENGFTGELAGLMDSIGKVHGDKVVRRASIRVPYQHIPLDIFTLDMALLGGVPEGLATVFYGWEHSGKTTMAMRAIAGAQRKYPDRTAVFVDVEGTYAPEWGEMHGIDNDKLLLVQPDSGEQALDITVSMVKTMEVSIVVVDSLAALIPVKEIERSLEDVSVGEQARLISRFCTKLQNALITERHRGHRPAVVLVNQFRMKVGVMHGDPRTLPGGVAQNFLAAVKVEMKNKEHMGSGEDVGHIDYNEHSFTVKKNKVGTAVRVGEFKMVRSLEHPMGLGFVEDGRTAITWAKKMGLVTGGSPKLRVEGIDRDFRVLQDIEDYLYQNPEEYRTFRHRLISDYREKCGLNSEGWYNVAGNSEEG